MKFTLPKSLQSYITPESREHEVRLSIVWKVYLNRSRDLHVNDFALEHLNQSILSEIFNVPMESWWKFSPRAHASSKSVASRLQNLAKSLQKKEPTKSHTPKRKRKKPPAEKVIVRRCSQANADGTYPTDIITRPSFK
jgi:hypothetical protein